MTVFERITESPEVLGKFLAYLPVVEGPWDDKKLYSQEVKTEVK